MHKDWSIRRLFGVPFVLWGVLFVVLPLFFVLHAGLTDEVGTFTLAVLGEAVQWEYLKALGLSVLLALVSTLASLVPRDGLHEPVKAACGNRDVVDRTLEYHGLDDASEIRLISSSNSHRSAWSMHEPTSKVQ